MIRVISIGTDRKVFEEGSAVRERLLKQRALFLELHIIVFTSRFDEYSVQQIGNLWLYPTNSLSRWLYIRDAVSLARAIITQRAMTARPRCAPSLSNCARKAAAFTKFRSAHRRRSALAVTPRR